jgi:hypothetical protein
VTAAQFMESCHGTLFKPVLFNFAPPPSPEHVKHVVEIAVRVSWRRIVRSDRRASHQKNGRALRPGRRVA